MVTMTEQERILKIAQILKNEHPSPKTELTHKNEYELTVAVMLSAQTTDKKVNQITLELFKKYKSWEDLANAELTQLQGDIHGVNFHLGKADRLIKAGKFLMSEYGGKLPRNLDELILIPGVARKSANVILQELWDVAEGIVVDTHVTRVSQRLGITKNTDAVKIEKDLMAIVPKEYWRNFSGAVVLHGRYVCIARKPKCEECVLNKVCPSAFKF
ncbi:endonuclease III [candidate division WWE3 bacterium]|jgi:endonuclease-3|uniref:Endonuclease III n=1 Tax=candidate division WWE3 bacterium TaxID=2053526 RepID=A0A3A4ZD06_UNCKA|nr:MAG: endonuclease III [candidate division WWE3 bacterium]